MAIVKYSIQRLEHENFLDKIREMLVNPHNKTIYYSAFLSESSVLDVSDLLQEESDLTAVIGVRNGVTSAQGLKALLKTGVKVFVVDTGTQTTIFHAKSLMTIDENNEKAYVVIGSSNFTFGGFHGNIENNVFLELDLKNENDEIFYKDFIAGFNKLMSYVGNSDNVYSIVSELDVDNLLLDGRIVDETYRKVKIPTGKSNESRGSIKKMDLLPVRRNKRSLSTEESGTEKRISRVILESLSGQIEEVWMSKELMERDLSIPSGSNTNSTGSMLMKKGAYNIDQQKYFYDTVFNQLNWSNRSGKPLYNYFADAKFHFIIEGIDFGVHTLTLKYDSRTDTKSYLQKQPNVSLSWGSAGKIIKNSNLLGKIMHLYRILDKTDEFLIEIIDE